MKPSLEIALDSFFDGFTGAGLFGRLRRPGAPTEFVDSRTVEQSMAAEDFAAYTRLFNHSPGCLNSRSTIAKTIGTAKAK